MQRSLRKHTAAARLEYAAIGIARRNNAAMYYVPKNLAGAFSDNAGATQATVGGLLGYWRDSQYGIGGAAGSGTPMIRLSAATRPSVAQLANGHYAITFNGTDHCMSATGLNSGAAGTWIAAGTPATAHLGTFVGSGGQSTTVAGIGLGLAAANTARSAFSTLSVANSVAAGAYTAAAPVAVSVSFTTTDKSLRVGGALVGSNTDTIDPTSTLGTAIGRVSTTVASEFFGGTISLICMSPAAMSDESRQAIERFSAYLSGASFSG